MAKNNRRPKRRRERPRRVRKTNDGTASMTVSIAPGIVAVSYDRPLQHMRLSAADAMAMGSRLMKAAKEASERELREKAGLPKRGESATKPAPEGGEG